jgi:chromosome partitioning protein
MAIIDRVKEVIKPKRKGKGTIEIPQAPTDIIRNAEVWALPARKGGVLKTSLVVNIAGVLASQGKRVLAVDLDSQGNVLLSFGGNPDAQEYTVYNLLTMKNAPVTPAIHNVFDNIDVIPANEMMDELDFEVIPDKEKFPFPFTLLREALSGLRCDYDYILIDTPPNSVLIQSNALMFADKVLIPFQPEAYSMRSVVKTINNVEKFKARYNPKLELMGIVATLVNNQTNVHIDTMEEIRKFCRKRKYPLLNTVIPRLTRGASDISYNRLPTTLASPNDRLARHYFDLIEEVSDLD